jgi:Tfp pilus assembly protein PilW
VFTSCLPFPVTGAWSNRRAQAGFDPCTPNDHPFAFAYPQQTSVDLSCGGAEFDVDCYAEDATACTWR